MKEGRVRQTQEERRDESEQRMLAAGLRLVAEHGPEKLTLTEVGKSAGYSRGLPAHHFGSREQYLKALASHVAIEFDQTLASAGFVSGLDAVLKITRAVLTQLHAHPSRGLATHVVLADARRDQALSEDIAGLRDKTLALLASHIREGIRSAEIRSNVSPEIASLLIAAGICGLIDSWLADPGFSIATAGDQLIDMIEHALSAETATSRSTGVESKVG
ncbi:TetR/AcrR family transcriptional regulator [Martelella sp. AD-3]|uniref:TetR/AcrR family transcriptional regulator n=1 Tax=Martelella sp. AD-3 TaxID=686597 RepID=UPI00046727DF|nr:TetR/AcrR family transcriptional regulator [Martelella sp. AD-3]AMM84717.1 hypothetical protein AZF01_10430 [Martelella sp. AD-3]